MWFPSTVYLYIMLPSSDLQTKIIQFLHVLFLSCKESFEKFKWIDIYTKHAGKSIPHSSNSERKDYFLKAQRNIHCYPASDAFSRMNYCQSTVVTTYLCCCLIVRFNVKTMLIQPEETLVKLYYFQLQQPEFLAVNKIITPRHFFTPWDWMLSSRGKEHSPMLFSLAMKFSQLLSWIITSGITNNIRRMLNAPHCSSKYC